MRIAEYSKRLVKRGEDKKKERRPWPTLFYGILCSVS
jgi:hypothetical protein